MRPKERKDTKARKQAPPCGVLGMLPVRTVHTVSVCSAPAVEPLCAGCCCEPSGLFTQRL